MARLAGEWGPATVTGDRVVTVQGTEFRVPADAILKRVQGSGFEILHVKDGRSVYVLSSLGQLIEDDPAAKSRATVGNWTTIPGTFE